MGRCGYGVVLDTYNDPKKGLVGHLGLKQLRGRTAREKGHATAHSYRPDDAHDFGGQLGVFAVRRLEDGTDPVDESQTRIILHGRTRKSVVHESSRDNIHHTPCYTFVAIGQPICDDKPLAHPSDGRNTESSLHSILLICSVDLQNSEDNWYGELCQPNTQTGDLVKSQSARFPTRLTLRFKG